MLSSKLYRVKVILIRKSDDVTSKNFFHIHVFKNPAVFISLFLV